MGDLDFDLDSPQPKDFYWDNFVGLCAEVRRLRAIEDAAKRVAMLMHNPAEDGWEDAIDALVDAVGGDRG